MKTQAPGKQTKQKHTQEKQQKTAKSQWCRRSRIELHSRLLTSTTSACNRRSLANSYTHNSQNNKSKSMSSQCPVRNFIFFLFCFFFLKRSSLDNTFSFAVHQSGFSKEFQKELPANSGDLRAHSALFTACYKPGVIKEYSDKKLHRNQHG